MNNQRVYKHCRAQAAATGDGTRNTRGRASGKIIICALRAVSGQILAMKTKKDNEDQ